MKEWPYFANKNFKMANTSQSIILNGVRSPCQAKLRMSNSGLNGVSKVHSVKLFCEVTFSKAVHLHEDDLKSRFTFKQYDFFHCINNLKETNILGNRN